MNLTNILNELKGVGIGNVVTIGIALLSIIQISPIKIDPWSKFFKLIGRMINGEVMDEIKSLKTDLVDVHKELDDINETSGRRDADAARNRILRFDDELRRKVDHSEEFFDQILDDITFYRKYCNEHDSYPNAKANSAMRNIETVYDICREENKFI